MSDTKIHVHYTTKSCTYANISNPSCFQWYSTIRNNKRKLIICSCVTSRTPGDNRGWGISHTMLSLSEKGGDSLICCSVNMCVLTGRRRRDADHTPGQQSRRRALPPWGQLHLSVTFNDQTRKKAKNIRQKRNSKHRQSGLLEAWWSVWCRKLEVWRGKWYWTNYDQCVCVCCLQHWAEVPVWLCANYPPYLQCPLITRVPQSHTVRTVLSLSLIQSRNQRPCVFNEDSTHTRIQHTQHVPPTLSFTQSNHSIFCEKFHT